MKIIHHNDNDGYCAAAVVRHYLVNIYDVPTEKDFFVYNYSNELEFPEIHEGETVYIVDLSLCDTIVKLIRYVILAGGNVVHIDHHKSTFDYLEDHPDVKEMVGNITTLYDTHLSGALLTFLYDCMSEEERKNPMDVDFYMGEETGWRLQVGSRFYDIPPVIRYVDDYDRWVFRLPETKMFAYGFDLFDERTKPWAHEWADILMNGNLMGFIDAGEAIYAHKLIEWEYQMKGSHEIEFEGHKCLCVNTTDRTSDMLGDKINEYPMCMLYRFNGTKWVYSLRSGENGIDVSEVAKRYGGGGHPHAAGFSADNLVI